MATYSVCYVANPGFSPSSIFVFCGQNTENGSENYSNNTLEYVPVTNTTTSGGGNAWISRTASRTVTDGRSSPSCAAITGDAFLMGGGGTLSRTLFTDKFTKPSTWVTRLDMLSPARWKAAAAPIGGSAVIFGGSQGTTTPDIIATADIYAKGANTWTNTTDLTSARMRHTATTVASKAYIMGGLTTDTGGTDVPISLNDEFSAGSYTSKTALTTATAEQGATAISAKIYCIGGTGGYFKNIAYDPSGNSWATKADLIPPGRHEYPGCTVQNLMFIPGGKKDNGQPSAHTTQYDPASDSYILRADLIGGARRNHGGTGL